MAAETYPINIWINEERFEKLQEAGMADLAKDVLAGMKVIQVQASPDQTAQLLRLFPMAKYDTATTKTIELLPRTAKDSIFALVIERRSVNILDAFLESQSASTSKS